VPDLPSGNAAIGQSGGPTAVINQSLAGVVEGLKAGLAASGKVKRILGMRHGVRGLVKSGSDGLVDLTGINAAKLEAIARTPSAALGSTRDKPDEAYCERILAGARANDIRYFFYIGGNDSADTCRIARWRQPPAMSSAASMCRRPSTTISWRTTTRRASPQPRDS
jgi:6-phosphofructokinase 1